MGSEFVEPKPFSIDENSLENMLVNIGKGNTGASKPVNVVDKQSKSDENKDLNNLYNIISGLPDEHKKHCISLLEKYAIKFNMNIVCKNTQSITEEQCSIGSKEKEILYNNFSIQGPWSGLEVIITGDNGFPIVAKSKGQEWDNCSKHFKINKI